MAKAAHESKLPFTLKPDFLGDVVLRQKLQTYRIARINGDDCISVVPRDGDMRVIVDDMSQGSVGIYGLAAVAMIGPWFEDGCSLQFYEEMPDYPQILNAGYQRTESNILQTVSLLEKILIEAGGRGIKRVDSK